MSAFKTGLLMVIIFVLFIVIGSFFGPGGMTIAFILALVLNLGTYWFSDRIVLAMYRAQEVSPAEAPRLHAAVEELSEAAGIPKPKVYVIPNPGPNAFATGRNPENAAVAVTTGIMDLLNDRELRGVIGHELAHVRNRDILLQTVVATIAGAITFLAFMLRWGFIFGGAGGDDDDRNPLALLLVAILAPIAAVLIQMWISRTREYAADAHGANIAGDPRALAGALRKLEIASHRRPVKANPATAHMFIVAPFTGRSLAALFSTHPPVEERVARLERMAIKAD